MKTLKPIALLLLAYIVLLSASPLLAQSGRYQPTKGLSVVVGFAENDLIASPVTLLGSDAVLLQLLDSDADKVANARQRISDNNLYGKFSIDSYDGRRLPYVDRSVNEILIRTPQPGLTEQEMMRVLVPGGTVRYADGKTVTKPLDTNTDDWTHYLNDADNNAVADDELVGPPSYYQWIADPKHARAHEQLASISAVVTTGGRLFFIIDEGPTASIDLPPDWKLVCRDAYNGVLLWKLPIAQWEGHKRGFRSGPAEMPRRLVATQQAVYATLGYGEPVSEIDAATGRITRVFQGTEGTTEIIATDKMLYLVVGEQDQPSPEVAKRRGENPPVRNRRIIALDIDAGKPVWVKSDAETAETMPLTMVTDGHKLMFHNPTALICLDATTGAMLWKTPRELSMRRPAWSTPTVVLTPDVILSADREPKPQTGSAGGFLQSSYTNESNDAAIDWLVSSKGGGANGTMIAYSTETGEPLWSCDCAEGYTAPTDVFVIDNTVWCGTSNARRGPDMQIGRDLKTGEMVAELDTADAFSRPGMPHHRCYRAKASSDFFIMGRAGTELIDVASGEDYRNHWIRGACQYGIMPANGLMYIPAESCACFLKAKLDSFKALSATRQQTTAPSNRPRLEKGPAYDASMHIDTIPSTGDWPTYRHDSLRSGTTDAGLPSELKPAWQISLGENTKLTAPVIADGVIYVAAIDRHTLYAISATDGSRLWSFTTGSRIDSPPTIDNGRVLMGSADGYIYCLRSSDGKLAWRYQAAPEDRRMVVYDQLESVWPVSGSVLVRDGELWAAAGRSSFVDGGIRIVRLNPKTGELIGETTVSHRDENMQQPDDTIKGFDIDGALVDVLSTRGEHVFMRHIKFDAAGNQLPDTGDTTHLYSQTGFLDDTWWHRSYWLWGDHFVSGWGGWWKVGHNVPSGRILAVDNDQIFGFGRDQYPGGNSGQWAKGEKYQLFSAIKREASEVKKDGPPVTIDYYWTTEPTIEARAMVKAKDRLCIAGPLAGGHLSMDRYTGADGVKLQVVSADSGETLSEQPLDAMPVFDGMAAADVCLFMTLQDGTLRCFE